MHYCCYLLLLLLLFCCYYFVADILLLLFCCCCFAAATATATRLLLLLCCCCYFATAICTAGSVGLVWRACIVLIWSGSVVCFDWVVLYLFGVIRLFGLTSRGLVI